MKTSALTKGRIFTAETAIKKWGNSQGIRLSKEITNLMELNENYKVKINIQDGKMEIEKIKQPVYKNLTERLEAFYNKPIEEIYVESTQEVDVGALIGNEVW